MQRLLMAYNIDMTCFKFVVVDHFCIETSTLKFHTKQL